MPVWKKWFWKIITCNGRFFTKKQAQIEANTIRTSLKISDNTDVNVSALIQALGSIDNLITASAVINTVSVTIHDWNLVNQAELKQLGVKGLMRSGDKIKLVFGDDSHLIAAALTQALKTHKTPSLDEEKN